MSFVAVLVAVVAVLYAVCSGMSTLHTYVFDKKVMQDIATEAVRSHNTSEGVIRATIAALQARYPQHIVQEPYENLEWLFNNAGKIASALQGCF